MLKRKKEYRVSVLTTIILNVISTIIGLGGACFCIFFAGEISYEIWTIIVVLSVFLVTMSVTVLSVWIPETIKYGRVMGIKKFLKTNIHSKNDVIIFKTLMLTVVVPIAIILLAIISLLF